METTFFIFLSVAAVGVGAVLFVGWFAVQIVRVGGRVLRGLIGGGVKGGGGDPPPLVRCARRRCGEMNPPEARFCRRCGIAMGRRTAAPNNRARLPGGGVETRKLAG